MMRRAKWWGSAVMWLWCVACQGPATDVGNPTVNPIAPAQQGPTAPPLQQLLGAYSPAGQISPSIPSTDGDTEAPPQPMAIPPCQIDTGTTASIAMVNGSASTLLLDHFFAYGPSTEQIVAAYHATEGVLTLDVHDDTVELTCTGTVQQSGAALAVQFVCDVNKPIDGMCAATFTKQSV